MGRQARVAARMTNAALRRPSSIRTKFNEFIAAHATAWEVVFAALAIAYVGLDVVFESADPWVAGVVAGAEIGITIIFVAEFVLRLWAAPNRSSHLRRHWIDALALLPPIRSLRALRLVRLVRVFSGVHRVGMNVPALAKHRGFLSLLFTWIGLGVVLSLAVYTAERSAPLSNLTTPLDAIWWGVGSLTTAGSELFPVTGEGRIAAMMLTLMGAFIFSAITATITSFLVGGQSRPLDMAGQLERLNQMYVSGGLTADEFTQAKARVVAG